MAQSLSPEGFGGGRKYPRPVIVEGPSRFLSSIGSADGPETPLVIEFVGISEAEQRAAIKGFPGGRRFVLRAPRTPRTLLRQS